MPAALRLALVALLVATRITTAQETATEQVAAADVIRRMSELERSLALPQLVARLGAARDARRDAVIAREKDLMDRELLAMADDITRHPETGWKEERSVKILTDYLTAHGFDVEPGVAGLKTAFVARYRKGTPGPNLGVIVEYDALRGTSRDFHGDQHSAQGPVGDRKSTRLNSSHLVISYAVFCLKKKKNKDVQESLARHERQERA